MIAIELWLYFDCESCFVIGKLSGKFYQTVFIVDMKFRLSMEGGGEGGTIFSFTENLFQ